LNSVYTDDVAGGGVATRHLLELGHRRIAFVGDLFDNRYCFTSSVYRRAGFQDTMRRAGLEVAPAHIKEGVHSQEAALRLASELLSLPEPPTAIFAASDTQALGVLEAGDRSRYDRTRDRQIVGGPRHVALLDHRHEDVEIVRVEAATDPVCPVHAASRIKIANTVSKDSTTLLSRNRK